ncbi:DNA-binding transcriptional regulator, FadR family [Agromyces sp. CF514]|uniref:FadR/GntR family transcriptional regulator n=1 Tax=Agromyces sp. CF514 TaxID=1881031 RepID=UPI0008E7A7A3|nr:GntR family transcriptional regulator [Agromyces sp. CF514]SFR66733.1 DNA-binding transcriptional regulator, FadR family [Agromyces sp. CF514]
MPHAAGRTDATRAVVFAPLDGAGRAELVEQRITDAIVAGVLRDGERLPSESDLAKSLGVAVVTAREALVALRDNGLVHTRRGRDGGSFVTFDPDTSARMVERRLRSLSRVEIRDLSLHYSAIAGMAAEVAADRASEDDLANLADIDARADLTTAGGARRAVGRFQLEIAAVSQSPRLVHEELRLQAEAGPLLWMCLREEDARDRSRIVRLDLIQAIRDVQPERARRVTTEHIAQAVQWLVDEKSRIDQAAHPAGGPASASDATSATAAEPGTGTESAEGIPA